MKFLVGESSLTRSRQIDPETAREVLSSERIELLYTIAEKRMTAEGLSEELDIDRQTVYYHLKRLGEAELVTSTQEKPRRYRVAEDAFHLELRDSSRNESPSVEEVPCGALSRFFTAEGLKCTVVTEDSDQDSAPLFRYKVSGLATLLGSLGRSRPDVVTRSCLEDDHSGNLIEVARSGTDFVCETENVDLSSSIRVQGKEYDGYRTGIVVDSEEGLIVSGNTDLGTASAIEWLLDNYRSSFGAVLLQGFGSVDDVKSCDVLARYELR